MTLISSPYLSSNSTKLLFGAFIAGCALGLISGCQDSTRTSSGSGSMSSSSNSSSSYRSDDSVQRMLEEMKSELDETYVIGPTAAEKIGYRLGWNSTAASKTGSRVKTEIVEVSGDSIFLVDSSNNLTRVLRKNGSGTWSWAVADSDDHIRGVSRSIIGDLDRTIVLTEGDVHVFETNNGLQLDRQSLERLSATAPLIFGEGLIYGAANGQIIWHHYGFKGGAQVRGHALSGSISAPISLHKGMIVAVTDQGNIKALDAGNGGQFWKQWAREGVVAKAAISDQAVYIASLDQYLYAFNARYGDLMWKKLHAGPLRNAPVLIGENVYIQTPNLGLACYEALPFNDLDGNLLWNAPTVKSNVIGRHRSKLLAWDGKNRVLTLVDESSGDVIDTISLPKVKFLRLSTFDSGEIYAVSDRGEISKLLPKN